jgi:hypothetical protein
MRKLTAPSAADTAKKWAEVTPGRATYYEKNAPAAAGKQNANAIAAQATFKAAITAAGIDARFAGGLRKAGAEKYKRKVETVGKDRFGPGITAGQPDMQAGVDPYLAEIAATEVADRGPRGADTNYGIVTTIGKKLHAKRLSVLGATPA